MAEKTKRTRGATIKPNAPFGAVKNNQTHPSGSFFKTKHTLMWWLVTMVRWCGWRMAVVMEMTEMEVVACWCWWISGGVGWRGSHDGCGEVVGIRPEVARAVPEKMRGGSGG
nr:hypothetical protein [Tanacetum cinerariifolium]